MASPQGPGDNQLTLTSWSGIRTLDLRNGNVTSVPPPTFRDQFMRIVVGPGDFARRLVASLSTVEWKSQKVSECRSRPSLSSFAGSIGVAQFSSDGQRMLILSGGDGMCSTACVSSMSLRCLGRKARRLKRSKTNLRRHGWRTSRVR